jgi:hypothetical protein
MSPQDGTPRSLFTSFLASGKDLIALLRDGGLLLVLVLLLAFPASVNTMLTNAGFEEGSLVGFKWKAKLVETDQTLKEAQTTITDLKAQLDKAAQALSEAQAQTTDAPLKASLSKVAQESREVKASSDQVQANVRSTIAGNASLVEKAQAVLNPGGVLGVVFGGDASVRAATDEIARAARAGVKDAKIYLRQGSFRSVALAEDRARADEIVAAVRRFRADAYVVTMGSWCPNPVARGDHLECAAR